MVIRPRNVRHGRKKHGLRGVTLSHRIRVPGSQCRVPEVEQIINLLLGNRLGHSTLRHNRGVVLGDLPFSILKDIHECVSSLDLGARGTHSEFIDPGVLCPIGTNDDVPALNLGWYMQ